MSTPTEYVHDRMDVTPYRALNPPNDAPQRFQQVLDDYLDKHLLIPEHQRDATAWEHDKRQNYVERLRGTAIGSHPPGSFATYQLIREGSGAPSPTYLNDGYQRLSTLDDLSHNPPKYGMDTQGVRELLQQQISVQHRHYRSPDEAMRDFQLINNGTRLTPHELCHGFLKYMNGYESDWRPLFDSLENIVAKSEHRLRSRNSKKQRRDHEHKLRRHTLALFHRFLTEEQTPRHYPDVTSNDVQKYVDTGQVIELRLRDALLTAGVKRAEHARNLFERFVDDETAVIQECVRDVLGEVGLAPTMHRWLLDLAVWRRHSKTSRQAHHQFVCALMVGTGGRSQWSRDEVDPLGNKHRQTVTLNLCHLGLLPKLANWAGMPEFCEPQRRGRRPVDLLPGYEHSHVEPFVEHGDGETFAEPGPWNKARGARPVEDTQENEK